MRVAGVMSGTSCDGINVALVDITEGASRISTAEAELLGHAEFPYPKTVRNAVFSAMNARSASAADLARLNFLLAELYAEAIIATQRRFRVKIQLVRCHGQTIYHQGESRKFLGESSQ